MAVSNFSEEVWAALKLHWTTSPKISWQQLVNEIGERLQTDMPNITTVRRRAIAEAWQKDAKNAVKKSTRQLKKDTAKIRQKVKQQTADSNKKVNAKNASENTPKIAEILPYAGNPEVLPSLADDNQLKTATVILKQRRRALNLGILIDDTLDGILAVQRDFPDTPTQAELELAQNKLSMLAGMTELTEKLSRSIERVAKVEAVFYGLEIEELKDQAEVTARRNQVIEHSGALLEEQKQIMLQNKRLAIQRKARLMNEGDPDLDDAVEEE